MHPDFSVYADIFWFSGTLGTLFWLWMLFDCVRNEPDRGVWLIIIIFLHALGAALYFFVRKLPDLQISQLGFFKRLANSKILREAQYDANQIGNCFHHTRCGELLYEMKDYKRSKESFDKALQKDPHDITALWGASRTEYELKDYGPAKTKLDEILKRDPKYKFGDASLMLGRVLFAMKDYANAKTHLSDFLRQHGSPEARILLAQIFQSEKNSEEAKKQLQIILEDVRGLPQFYAVRNRAWINKAKRMLWTLR